MAVLLCLLAACAGTSPRTEPEAAPVHTPTAAAAPAMPAAAPPIADAAQDAATPPPPLPRLDDENSIFFAVGSSRIDAAGLKRLERHAARLKANPRLVVTLVGHTDHLGSRSYNLAIAERRTTAVAEQLGASGARRSQVRHYGVGNEKAVACNTADCRQRMRRVDLIYSE